MHYKIIIVDNNEWMYRDMAFQIITQMTDTGHKALLIPYEFGENTSQVRYVFLGTAYNTVRVPVGSIVSNFDNNNHLDRIISQEICETCTIWDYSQENIDLILKKYPHTDCYIFQMGYSPLLDHSISYDEKAKDIDVLMLGAKTPKRMKILNMLRDSGYNVLITYRKTGEERAKLLHRSKISVSIYGSEHTHCISSSRFTPILCNNGFIVTENCSNKKQNNYWSKYTVSVDYNELYNTIVSYLHQPEKRKKMADEFYKSFKQTRSKITK